jgi:hypothetical protein
MAEFATNIHQSETTNITPFFANNSCHPCSNVDIREHRGLLGNHDAQEYAIKPQEIHSLI